MGGEEGRGGSLEEDFIDVFLNSWETFTVIFE